MITLMTVVLLGTTMAQSQTFEFNPKRTVKLLDVVNGRMAVESMSVFDRLSRTGEPIHVLINSPGGSIMAGNLIINAMRMARARGSELHCVSTVYSASMAFQFLMECSHRYAFKYTRLLFHPPRVMAQGPMLAGEMEILSKELREIEQRMIPTIRKVLVGMNDSEFYSAYNREIFWEADHLVSETNTGWLKLVNNVTGLRDVFQLFPDRPRFSFSTNRRGKHQLIWIAPDQVDRLRNE